MVLHMSPRQHYPLQRFSKPSDNMMRLPPGQEITFLDNPKTVITLVLLASTLSPVGFNTNPARPNSPVGFSLSPINFNTRSSWLQHESSWIHHSPVSFNVSPDNFNTGSSWFQNSPVDVYSSVGFNTTSS